MISYIEFAAKVIIVGGAALGGAMVCWDLRPLRLELSSDQLALLGAVACSLVELVGCFFAIERSEAHTRNRDTILRLQWMLLRREENGRAAEATSAPQEPFGSISVLGANGLDPNAKLHAEGMKLR